VEAACDGLITHRARETTTPSKLLAAWPESKLPALKGKSPRQAVRTRAGRHAVDMLLKQLENTEAGLPPEERMDISELRRELGLEG
jgi:hypothetical protein